MQKRRSAFQFLFAGLLAGMAFLRPEPAHAQFEYCNQTSFYLFTALAAEARNGQIRSQGWWLVRPGECRVVEPNPLNAEVYYTFAESHHAHQGGIRTWGGRSNLCTATGLFAIDQHTNCFNNEFEPRSFSRVVVGDETSWTVNLTEPDDYTGENARHAAAQRMLNDLGYSAGVVDGYLGRRTRRAITRFKDEHDIDDDSIVSNTFLDALIAEVAETQQVTGYQFCNQTEIELWAAMGYAVNENWETRGWWSLEPGTCTKALNDGLPSELIYTYAVGYLPDGEVIEFGGDYPLCTGDQAFEISGNGDCETRGFTTVGFERVETEGEGWQQFFRMDLGDVELNELPETRPAGPQ